MSGKKILKILEVGVYDDTRTIALMDRFEGFGHDTVYQQLVLRNMAYGNYDGHHEYLSLVVERSKDRRYIGNITFTELKKGQTRDLCDFLEAQITGDVIKEYKDKDQEYRFKTPYLFRSQNSKNRSGWGYGGTQYGESTAYVFVGVYIGFRSKGFSDQINAILEDVDLTEFSIKNKSDSPSVYIPNHRPVEFTPDESTEEVDDFEFDIIDFEDETETHSAEEFDFEDISEKRCIPDEENKPTWFYAGFSYEINLFILALEQKIYLPPIIDQCEQIMQTDENFGNDESGKITDLERTFMFVEMLSNAIGYSGASVISLDHIHKSRILNNVLLRNIDTAQHGEYGDQSLSIHLVAEFLDNQPDLVYRGYVELILSKYHDSNSKIKYELLGSFKDFGYNAIEDSERHFWIGKDMYVLDEQGEGSYLQGIYEMAKNY